MITQIKIYYNGILFSLNLKLPEINNYPDFVYIRI